MRIVVALAGCAFLFIACLGEDPERVSNPPADAAVLDAGIESAAAPPPDPGSPPPVNDSGTPDEACSYGRDLCRPPSFSTADGGATPPTYNPDAYTMFTIPSQPRAGIPFDLYVVTKNKLSEPGLWKDALCYGGGLIQPCPNAGPNCPGWRVGFFRGLTENAGTYKFTVVDPRGVNGCDGTKVSELTVSVN